MSMNYTFELPPQSRQVPVKLGTNNIPCPSPLVEFSFQVRRERVG